MTRSIEPASRTLPDDFRAFYDREHSVQVRWAFLLTGSGAQGVDNYTNILTQLTRETA